MPIRVSKTMAEDLRWATTLRDDVSTEYVWQVAIRKFENSQLNISEAQEEYAKLAEATEPLSVPVRFPEDVAEHYAPWDLRAIMSWYLRNLRTKVEAVKPPSIDTADQHYVNSSQASKQDMYRALLAVEAWAHTTGVINITTVPELTILLPEECKQLHDILNAALKYRCVDNGEAESEFGLFEWLADVGGRGRGDA